MQIWLHLGAQQVLPTGLAVSEDTISVIPRCDIEKEKETTETAKCHTIRNTDSYDKLRLYDTLCYVGDAVGDISRQKM
jgi:hypothetical protein